MTLKMGDVQLIMEALIITKYYTGDNQYQNVLDKILKIEKEEKEKRKRVIK